MYRYIFTLATLLDSKSKVKKQYPMDTVICELFDENLDERLNVVIENNDYVSTKEPAWSLQK